MKWGDIVHKKVTILYRLIFCLIVISLTLGSGPAKAVDGSLHIALPAGPKSLNFFGATDLWSQKVLRFLHMPLYIRGPVDGKMIPWLAESPPSKGDQPNEVIIKLREAKWDDGSDVTVEDLIFTVKVIQEFNVPSHIEKWQDVVKMQAVDRRTIRFTLRHGSPGFFNRTLFTGFVQKKEWEPIVRSARECDDPLKKLADFDPQMVPSNGPFLLKTYTKPFFIVLKSNPLFFAKGLTIEEIKMGPHVETIFLGLNRDAKKSLSELKEGEIDFLWWDLPRGFINELDQRPNMTLYRTERKGYDYLAFNLTKPPFNDKAFRKAVSLLVNRDQIIKRVLRGDGKPVYSVIPPQNVFWSNPSLGDPGSGLTTEERIEGSKKILQKAGYSWKDGELIMPSGQKMIPMEIITTTGWRRPCRLMVALHIKKALLKIGVPVIARVQSLHKMIALLKKNSFDAYIMGWAHLSDDPDYVRTFFHSREARPGGKNYPRFLSSSFDELADAASREMDLPKRKKLVFEMQELIAREIPCIPLYTRNRVEAARNDRLKGWVQMAGGIGNLWSFVNLKPAK
jgi:peptide/nickel transport system substrate-binding protein